MWAVLRDGWARRPERVALSRLDGGDELTYRQLDEAVGRRADVFDRAGLGSGSRLGVALSTGHELVVTVLAGTACGAEVAVFNPGWWPRELRPALEAAEPDLTVTTDELVAIAADVGPACTPAEAGDGAGGRARLRVEVGGSRRPAWSPGDAGGGLVCFTAGVWGEPAAYHFGAAQLAEHWLGAVEPLDEGVTLLAGEAATAAGLRSVLQVLAAGGQLMTGGRWTPARIARRLRHGGVDRLWAGAGQLNQLAAHLATDSRSRFPPLARVDAPGGPVHRTAAELFGALLGAPVLTCYAVTEAGGPATAGATRTGSLHQPLDVGGARPGLAVAATGPDGAPQPWDELGELHLRGAALGRESPHRSSTAPDGAAPTGGEQPGGWPVPTGDCGWIDRDGHLHVVGKGRDRFECDGVAVWPQLVEQALASDPRIADVAVAPRPDPQLGTIPVAVTVPADPEHPPFLADLESVLAELPSAWRPRAQAIVDRLPLTATGQVHRRMLAYDEAAR